MKKYEQSLSILKTVGDQENQAVIQSEIAVTKRDLGDFQGSLTDIKTAINSFETLRTKIANSELRSSYFETKQEVYEFCVDLLMQLAKRKPTRRKSYEAEALYYSDRARARSLIELLTESRADIRKGIRKDLLDQARNLQQQLDVRDKRLAQLSSEKETQPQIVKIQQEIKGIYQQQEQLKGDIRANSPAYANLKYPEPLTFSQMQQQLDDNTLLLQYSLGEEHSYLWAVTKTGQIKSYPLPGRKEIEEAATNFYSALSAPQCDPQMPADCDPTFATDKGKALYQIILAQVIDQLPEKKRLLIVADGALQYIPFAALPMPDSQTYVPLVTKYEIVHAPSVSALAALKEQFGIRPPAPKLFAAIADPVFSLDRVSDRQPSSSITTGHTEALVSNTPNKSAESFRLELDRSLAARSLSDCGLNFQSLQPLPDTRTTAETILASIADPQRTIHRYGFDANLDWVTNTEQSHLNQYQMLLFATHGCANSVRPELSGIVLSLVDEKGQPQRGFLRLGDIFNLDLSADLVVLSACQTGLGKDIRGEGLVGLTRGFMYAGAKRVVTSLWNIDAQQPTADLLTTFFNGMRPTGRETPLPPAAALQTAQIAMWKKYRDPYYWAAFTLQGEWR